jgi:hypothetical protein
MYLTSKKTIQFYIWNGVMVKIWILYTCKNKTMVCLLPGSYWTWPQALRKQAQKKSDLRKSPDSVWMRKTRTGNKWSVLVGSWFQYTIANNVEVSELVSCWMLKQSCVYISFLLVSVEARDFICFVLRCVCFKGVQFGFRQGTVRWWLPRFSAATARLVTTLQRRWLILPRPLRTTRTSYEALPPPTCSSFKPF